MTDTLTQAIQRLRKARTPVDPFSIIERGRIRVPSISKDTAGKLIPLTPGGMKPGQRRVYEEVKDALLSSSGTVMVVVLKYRQAGMSTLCRALFSALSMCRDGYNAACIADTGDRSNLMQRIDKGIQKDMENRGVNLRTYKISNRRELIYHDSTSITRYLSDKEETVGISEARNGFHGTEIAYWRSWSRHWGDINPSIHDLPWNLVILESTANGSGDHWHRLWLDAGREDSSIIRVFLPWYEDYDLVKEPPEGWKPDEWEQSLVDRYNLKIPQIFWYHDKLYDPSGMGGNKALMAEKYPFTAEEAFQTSGGIVMESIKSTLNKSMASLRGGRLVEVSGSDKNLRLVPNEKGKIEVWHEREAGREYIMYSDVGEGIKHIEKDPQIIEGERITTTYSTCVVRDARSWELCAIMECQYPVGVFEAEARKLATYYNEAFWGIEIPGPGVACVELAHRAGYKHLYRHEWRDPDNELRKKMELGFRNDAKSKPQMESDWEELMRDRPELLGSVRISSQALTYIQDPKTAKHRPRSGCFSDILLADFGCVQLVRAGPKKKGRIKEKIKDYEKREEKRSKSKFKSFFR